MGVKRRENIKLETRKVIDTHYNNLDVHNNNDYKQKSLAAVPLKSTRSKWTLPIPKPEIPRLDVIIKGILRGYRHILKMKFYDETHYRY